MHLRLQRIAPLAFVFAATPFVTSAQTFPTKPVRLIVDQGTVELAHEAGHHGRGAGGPDPAGQLRTPGSPCEQAEHESRQRDDD